MKKIYLVKKNPEMPADADNWIEMNSFEFMNFVKTPEGQKRRAGFGQIDGCSVDDVIIIAECGIETAKKWRSEKDNHDYLVSVEKESGFKVFSYNTQTTTEGEMTGEELLPDKDCDVAGEVVEKLFRAELHNALAQLSEKERQIIFMLFGDSRISEAQCALTLGCTQQNIHYLKQRALQKMKNFLEN
jgi:RNA polymerase sigma factor (sigma-70 family)